MRNIRVLLCWLTLFVSLVTTAQAAEVCNAGFPGENSAQVLERLPKALALCDAPVAVVLFVGMNDAVNEKRFLRPDQTESAVVQMIRLIAAAHAETFIVTLHYPDEARLMQRHSSGSFDGQTAAQRIDATNRALRDAATQGGAPVIDFNAALSKAGGASARLSTDGVHLTRAGYELLALTVIEALPQETTHGRLLCLGDSLTYGTGVRGANSPDEGSDSYPQQLKQRLSSDL